MRGVIVVLSTVTVIASTAVAEDKDWDHSYVWRDTGIVETGHPWQLTFGLGYRTDESRWINQNLTMELGLLRFLNPGIAVVVRASYTPSARTENSYETQDINIVSGNISLRLQDPHARCSPFGEFGYDLKRYSGDLGEGQAWRTTDGGFSFGGGLAVRLTDRYAVDLSFRQVLNHRDVIYPLYSPLYVVPPIDGYIIPSHLNQEFYNPTEINLHFRIGL